MRMWSIPVSVLLMVAAHAACAAPAPPSLSDSPTTPAAGGEPSVRPLERIGDRPLAPGRYARDDFRPRTSFAVGEGWYAVQAVPGFFDVQRDPGTLDVLAVQFARPVEFRTADEAAAALRGRQGLVVGAAVPVRIGGLGGIRVTVDSADADLEAQRFVEVFRVAPGPISIASGRRLQVTFVDTNEGLLALLVGGSVRHWDAGLAAADEVLASIEIDS